MAYSFVLSKGTFEFEEFLAGTWAPLPRALLLQGCRVLLVEFLGTKSFVLFQMLHSFSEKLVAILDNHYLKSSMR